MAKGEGGGGHFDERRRAKAAPTGYADSPEVLSALIKPRSKPTVVIKKKKIIPSRVQVDSDPGDVPEAPTRMKVTRYNVGAGKPSIGTGLPKPSPVKSWPSVASGGKGDFGEAAYPIRSGALSAELRSQRKLTRPNTLKMIGGGGKSLLDWIKGRTTMKNLDT